MEEREFALASVQISLGQRDKSSVRIILLPLLEARFA